MHFAELTPMPDGDNPMPQHTFCERRERGSPGGEENGKKERKQLVGTVRVVNFKSKMRIPIKNIRNTFLYQNKGLDC